MIKYSFMHAAFTLVLGTWLVNSDFGASEAT
jgi:hypothetical protein